MSLNNLWIPTLYAAYLKKKGIVKLLIAPPPPPSHSQKTIGPG